ncbi:hypothetical protein K0U07_04430, partial [bacterium]|nr:hypothetical protein [bacterium]
MKKSLLILLLLFSAPLMGLPFKNIFMQGEKGDFSIYQNGEFVTLVHIHSKKDPYITFEEITLPKKLYKKIRGIELHTWLRNGAKGNTSWTLIEMDSNTLEVTSAYCFSRNIHLDLSKEDTLISSLLSLDVAKVPEEERQRIGPRRNTKKDHRLFWEPAMYVFGERKRPNKMDVYGGTWEKDGSPLSGKEIDIYVLDNFPFPYWLQIRGDFGLKKMVAIDSGKHLISPISEVPRMPPRFLSKLEKWGEMDSFSF